MVAGGACMVAPSGGMRGCSWGEGECMVAPGGWRHAWLLLGGGGVWDTMRYRDMINEQAVHILLKCILVN